MKRATIGMICHAAHDVVPNITPKRLPNRPSSFGANSAPSSTPMGYAGASATISLWLNSQKYV